MIQRARLAASLLLLAAFLPTTVAASEGPAVIATINLGPNTEATAFALAVNPNTNKTYVTPGWETLGCESHIVSVIDNSTNTVLAPITVGLSPFGVAVNPKTNRIYVANIGGALCTEESSNSVSVIDGSADAVEKTITLDGVGPAFVAVNPRTNKIYVTMNGGCCADGHAVAVIDGSTNAVLRYVDVDLNPSMVAVNPRTNLVYVTHVGDKITVIDGSTDTVVATFSIGSEARAIAFDSNGRFLYVAARNTNQLAVVDPRTNAVVQTVPVGRRPHGVVFNPDNGRIYVTNRGSCDSTPGTVSVIDSSTRTVEATVQVGACPRFLDRNPRTGLLYVPNASTSRSVSVIQDKN
jgi:YVTN family beta-propeller protein